MTNSLRLMIYRYAANPAVLLKAMRDGNPLYVKMLIQHLPPHLQSLILKELYRR